jgi:hypothetical protein
LYVFQTNAAEIEETSMIKALAAVAVMTLSGCAAAPPPFRPAVEAHFNAVASRNIDALLPTLTLGDKLTMIAPNGYRWETRQQYEDFHRAWFAAPHGGKFDYEIVDTVESATLGHALIRYTYTTTGQPQSGSLPEPTWLALTFALEEGAWRLVFDQNTSISPAPAR